MHCKYFIFISDTFLTYPIYLFCNILESQRSHDKTDIKYWASITTFTKLIITIYFNICNFLPLLRLICQSNSCPLKLNHHIIHTFLGKGSFLFLGGGISQLMVVSSHFFFFFFSSFSDRFMSFLQITFLNLVSR